MFLKEEKTKTNTIKKERLDKTNQNDLSALFFYKNTASGLTLNGYDQNKNIISETNGRLPQTSIRLNAFKARMRYVSYSTMHYDIACADPFSLRTLKAFRHTLLFPRRPRGVMAGFSETKSHDIIDRVTQWNRTNGDNQTWNLSFEANWDSILGSINGTSINETRTHNSNHEITSQGIRA